MKKKLMLLVLFGFLSFVFVNPSSAALLSPSADVYVINGGVPLSDIAFYNNANFAAGVNSSNFAIRSYIKFDLSGYTAADIGSATLYLKTNNTIITGPPTVGAYTTGNNTWVETTTTWNNQPGITGTPVNTAVSANNTWYAWDVTSFAILAAGGPLSLGLAAPSGIATFHSSQAVASADRPYLEVTPVPIPAAAWLLGSGLLGLVALRRRFKK